MKLIQLKEEEMVLHQGATHIAIVTHTDLTEATANTAQVIALMTVAAKMAVGCVKAVLKTPFTDASDAAFNTTAVTVGDGNSANALLTSMELNSNGTEVFLKFGTATQTVYTGADTVDITFNSMADKALVDIDAGEVHIYLKLTDARNP